MIDCQKIKSAAQARERCSVVHLLPRNFALVLIGARASDAASHIANLPFAVAPLQNVFNLEASSNEGINVSRKQTFKAKCSFKILRLNAQRHAASIAIDQTHSNARARQTNLYIPVRDGQCLRVKMNERLADGAQNLGKSQ